MRNFVSIFALRNNFPIWDKNKRWTSKDKKNPGKNYPLNVFKVKTKLINGILIPKKKSVIKSKGSEVKDAEQSSYYLQFV